MSFVYSQGACIPENRLVDMSDILFALKFFTLLVAFVSTVPAYLWSNNELVVSTASELDLANASVRKNGLFDLWIPSLNRSPIFVLYHLGLSSKLH